MPEFLVLPENQPVVNFFMAVQTQLGAEGFNYPGVRAAAEMMDINQAEMPAIFEGLQTMEYAILQERNRDNG